MNDNFIQQVKRKNVIFVVLIFMHNLHRRWENNVDYVWKK